MLATSFISCKTVSTLSAAKPKGARRWSRPAKTMATEISLAGFNCFHFFFILIWGGTLLSGRKTGLSDGQFSINSG